VSRNRVGGHKRRAWRLKKKYNKWFTKAMLDVANGALEEMPVDVLAGLFDTQDYSILRLYK
jgi:hypothetical protein